MPAAGRSGGVIDLTRGGRFDPFVLFRLARLIRKERAEIVHTHLVHADLIGRWAARVAGVRTIVTTRHYGIDHKAGSPIYRMADSTARAATAVVAISRAVAEHLTEQKIARPNRIAVIPNGVDPTLFDPALFPQRTDRPGGKIGAVGRLHPQKGFFPSSRSSGRSGNAPRCNARNRGEGPLRPSWKSEWVRSVWREPVRLPGSVLEGSDARDDCRLGSRRDAVALGRVWSRGGRSDGDGKPVVASNLEGLPELIEQAETGFVLRSPRGSHGSMRSWVYSKMRPSGIGWHAPGRQRILQHFDVRKMVASFRDALRSSLGDRRGAQPFVGSEKAARHPSYSAPGRPLSRRRPSPRAAPGRQDSPIARARAS